MPEDPRSCGSIACIINAEGRCWCGLQWNGLKMVRAPLDAAVGISSAKATAAVAKTSRKTPAKKARKTR